MGAIGSLAQYGIQVAAAGQAIDSARVDGHTQLELGQLNKTFYDMSANDAISRGNQDAAAAQAKGTQVAGAQQVGYAASGVDTSSGTPHQAMLDTRVMSSLDAAKLQNNAAREAWGMKIKGTQADMNGQLAFQNALDKEKSAGMQAAAQGITALTSFGMAAGGAQNDSIAAAAMQKKKGA